MGEHVNGRACSACVSHNELVDEPPRTSSTIVGNTAGARVSLRQSLTVHGSLKAPFYPGFGILQCGRVASWYDDIEPVGRVSALQTVCMHSM